MNSRSVSELCSLGLLVALSVLGCSSAKQGDTTGSTAMSGDAASSGGVTASSGGVSGNPSQPGSGGASTGGTAGTGDPAMTMAGSASVAGAGPSGASGASGSAGSAQAAGGASGMGGAGGATITPPDLTPCTANTLKAGNSTVMIPYANGNRDYVIHVPTSYTGMTRVPLVVDMHGSGQNAANQQGTSGWGAKADKNGFIVVYPNALNMRWNAGTCCSPSVEQNVDDVGFLRAVVTKVIKDGCIDAKRVYASGLSGGGLMCYRLACEAPDVFAAVAPVSGATVFSPCKPSIPVSVIAYRGLSDPLVPYNGGMPLQWYFQGAKADFTQWSMLDQCMGPTTMSHGICQTNTQCTGGADITLCSVNSGHVLYGDAANAGAAVPDVAWEIFQRHTLP
jgi:polyhydroxybutyrate depolymerase